jgi:hypothetical protein
MTSINSTTGGAALPTAQALFEQARSAGAAGSAPTTASVTPTGDGSTGLVVSSQGGTTTLPAESAGAFEGTNPTALDQPDETYPALIKSHVAVLRAIGTPEAVLQQLNAAQPQAEYMDRYIQGEIMQNPEGWDDFVGNQRGTARAGLQQLVPGIQLPAPGQGNSGYLPDGSTVSGVNVPGLSTPVLDPTTGTPQGEGLVKGLVIAGVVAGVGLLAWKFLKGRGAGGAKEASEAVKGLAGGGGADLAQLAGKLGGEGDDALRALTAASALGGGGVAAGAGTALGAQTLATLDSISRGHGAANGFLNSVGSSAVAFNLPFKDAAELALAERGMGVLEQLARNGGTVADLAAARVLTAQAGGVAAAGGAAASQLSGLKTALAGMANLIV